ncbi:MAG TPA: type II secretion system protein [Sulfurovum sp.]|nr:type II secretion system protein [Sulfurovum sp.]
MKSPNRKAFTMLELIFVIVVIGILSSIAVPKFAATRGDAVMTKAKTTVGSVRSAIATERQKRILRGEFSTITTLTSSTTLGDPIFDGFDGNTTTPVLEYPPLSCATTTSTSCWRETTTGAGTTASPTKYTFNLPTTGSVVFLLQDNRFVCETPSNQYCRKLTQ